jgi:hypothetical protein
MALTVTYTMRNKHSCPALLAKVLVEVPDKERESFLTLPGALSYQHRPAGSRRRSDMSHSEMLVP